MSPAGATALERLVRRDRIIVLALLALIVAAAVGYLALGAGLDMQGARHAMPMRTSTGMPGSMTLGAGGASQWSASLAALVLAMWVVMMIAMMLPSAAPMILLHAAMTRRAGRETVGVNTTLFVGGYVALWFLFALGASILQWQLATRSLMHADMALGSGLMPAVFLIGAGVYQWTPLKRACLSQCRSPLDFMLRHWRAGAAASFGMGARHGVLCLGCCWTTMLLLFVGGIMSPAWIGAIAVLVLLEKTAPQGERIARLAGIAMIAAGFVLLYRVL
ncbi:MAG TPA: DUF2182 domain-containing protein [Casimicrobiaceae bacterium]|nr:DUF2182 domain-containing protein [Casimicrobiaceae bacterium]